MKNTITLFLFTFLSIYSFAQSFEGKITYNCEYKSKMQNVKDEQLTQMMGSIQEYYIKDGEYKSEANGSFFQWQMYVRNENKLYNKVTNTDVIMFINGSSNNDEILKFEQKKDAVEILGYQCDELIFTCKSGVQKFYFNSQLSMDPKIFENHKYGNWFAYLSKAKALSLKSIIDTKDFTVTTTATKVEPTTLDKKLFVLPPKSKTMQASY